jgi:hypothetical protein
VLRSRAPTVHTSATTFTARRGVKRCQMLLLYHQRSEAMVESRVSSPKSILLRQATEDMQSGVCGLPWQGARGMGWGRFTVGVACALPTATMELRFQRGGSPSPIFHIPSSRKRPLPHGRGSVSEHAKARTSNQNPCVSTRSEMADKSDSRWQRHLRSRAASQSATDFFGD